MITLLLLGVVVGVIRNRAIAQPCNATITQFARNRTITQPCNTTIMQPSTQQSRNLATQQYRNIVTQE
jgi:hypothetical protein